MERPYKLGYVDPSPYLVPHWTLYSANIDIPHSTISPANDACVYITFFCGGCLALLVHSPSDEMYSTGGCLDDVWITLCAMRVTRDMCGNARIYLPTQILQVFNIYMGSVIGAGPYHTLQ